MKTNTQALAKALTALLPVTGKRTSLPVLSTVRIEARNGVLTLQASNLECFVSLDVECTGKLEACCVPARVFRSVVGFGLDTELTLVKGRLHVKTESSAIEIPTMDAGEFPPCLEVKEAPLAIDCAALADAIVKAGYAASTDQSRYRLQGVMFEQDKGTVYVASSDGRRLAMATVASGAAMLVVVPTLVIASLVTALQEKDAVLRMNENWIRVSYEGGFAMVKPMECKPVNFRQVIPNDGVNVGNIDRKSLLAALDMCAEFKTENQRGVVLTPGGDGLKVSIKTDLGAVDTVVAGKLRKHVAVMVDVEYLRAALGHLTSDTVPLAYHDDFSPIVINEGNVTAVVMPLRDLGGKK